MKFSKVIFLYCALFLKNDHILTILSHGFLTTANVCKSHGISHAIAVLDHSIKALEAGNYNLTPAEELAVKLAGLLHDADDSKFFPSNKNFENLRYIIRDQPEHVVNLTQSYDNVLFVLVLDALDN